MEPGRCHPIAAERFVAARLFPPEGSKDQRKPTLIIETLDGKVAFFADRLAAKPEDIHRAARERWQAKWKEPGPLLRRDRKKRPDLRTGRKMVLAGYLFAAAMVAVFGGLGGSSPSGSIVHRRVVLSRRVPGPRPRRGLGGEPVLRFLALKLWYRCPECGGRPVRAFEALPDVHFYCRLQRRVGYGPEGAGGPELGAAFGGVDRCASAHASRGAGLVPSSASAT
jgi:hypothetical protein